MSYYYKRTNEFELLDYEETLNYFQDVVRAYLESVLTLADSNSNVTNINSKNLNKLVLLSKMIKRNYEMNELALGLDDGPLLQSWISLGAVLEGSLQCFLKVYFFAYEENPVKNKKGGTIPIERLTAFHMIEYFFDGDGIVKEEEFSKCGIDNIRVQRNLIHLFAGDEIYDWNSLNESLKLVIEILLDLLSRLPEIENEYGSVRLCDEMLYTNVYSLKHTYFEISK